MARRGLTASTAPANNGNGTVLGFEEKLRRAADKLRGNLDGAEYKHVVLGLGDAENRSKDILGRVYEYFLSQFASAKGKKGGQFYTPRCVVRVLVSMLVPHENVRHIEANLGGDRLREDAIRLNLKG